MKRLILDHFRRWGWVLATAAVVEFAIGVATQSSSADNALDIFSIVQIQIALFTGAFLLSFDFQRGIARTISSLPLTALQIGRSWWLATVGLPCIALASLLFLGAATAHLIHSGGAFPWVRLSLSSLVVLLWLGTSFTLLMSSTQGFHGNWWDRTRTVIFSGLYGLMIGGSFLFLQMILNAPVKFASFMVVGTALTVVGWFRAEPYALGRTSFRLTALQSRDGRGQHRAPNGYGGLSYLISATCTRAFLTGVAMFALMPLFMALQGQMKSWRQAVETTTNMGSMFPMWFVVLFTVIPALMQLRFLRTLPIPTTRLAALIVVLPLLPLIALMTIMAGTAGLVSGTAAAVASLKGFMLTLAAAAFCVAFVGWMGIGRNSFALMILTMITFQVSPLLLQPVFGNREPPLGIIGIIVAASVALAFLITRRSLTHSSKAYRVQASPFANIGWGMGR